MPRRRRRRQGRLVLFMAVVIMAVVGVFAAAWAGAHRSEPGALGSSAGARRSGHSVAHASLPASLASYLGVYEAGTPRSYRRVANFAKAADRQPNIVGYYSGWRDPFATSFAERVRGHSAVTIVQIDPTGASIRGIAAGTYDDYLRSYADSVRDFAHPVIIGFGHEMNGTWFPWGYRHVRASTFVAAWRHIVTLFRGQGADNVTWLWTINADAPGTAPLASWWPGPAYVTWVGIDGYYYYPFDTFASIFGNTIRQVRAFTNKPILLAETAVGPQAGSVKIGDLFAGMRQYRTLGLIWFDIAQHQGIYHQNWRIEGNPAAEEAFRQGAATLTLVRP